MKKIHNWNIFTSNLTVHAGAWIISNKPLLSEYQIVPIKY